MKSRRPLPLSKALRWIGYSVLLVNGLSFLLLQGYFLWRDQKKKFKHACISTIVQTGPQKEALKTDYLVQLLDLSKDRPKKIKDFDFKKAQKKLLSSPVIKEAEIKTLDLGTLYIDYTVRTPIALLYDFENRALDEERAVFPLIPFFSPKNLPELYLGISASDIKGAILDGPKVELALKLLKLINEPFIKDQLSVRRIDLSKAFEKSYGRREIVIQVEDEIISKEGQRQVHYFLPQYLRLSTKNYPQELSNYLKLREELLKNEEGKLTLPAQDQTVVRLKCKIIDLRLEQLAFINE
ncbi:MAG TPA: hypothetical protein VLG76_05615 [Rhabdochlamydiaceae bacterium]|nr:hypothetical protein [Rhabdochlamydiaceae bacterium]